MNKIYLGDSVYGEMDETMGEVVLTTENGIKTTNRIVLEGPVLHNLIAWVKRFYPEILPT